MTSIPVRAADESIPQISRVPIGMAYAGTSINTTIFRVNAVMTVGRAQYVTYYSADGNIVVGKRDLAKTEWDLQTLSTKGNLADAHNCIVLGVSSDGLLHLCYDQHAQPLHYRVSEKPGDIHSFGDEKPMTGHEEQHVTYPEFVNSPDGTLYFFYRDGASGNGNLCLNRYDPAAKSWIAMAHPLIDGQGKCNPYWWRPAMGEDGSIHLAWCWRDRPDASTNHDICYTQSRDGGKTWLRSDGQPQATPITRENAEVIDPIARGSNLINQCTATVDAQGHPHLAQYFNDDAGTPQYFHIWFDGKQWQKNQVSRRSLKFSIGGSGSLAIPICRPEIAIGKSGTVYIITRDAEFGGGIRLYSASAPYQSWQPLDLTHEDLGNWEPTYDLARWKSDGVLDLFVLPVRQGNHEKTTDFPPQEAALLELKLP
jgi:hypothetical protein